MKQRLVRDFISAVEVRLKEHDFSNQVAMATELIAGSGDRHALAVAIRNVGEYLKATGNLLEGIEDRHAIGAARQFLRPLKRVVELGVWDELFLTLTNELDKDCEKEWLAHSYSGILSDAKAYLAKAVALVEEEER